MAASRIKISDELVTKSELVRRVLALHPGLTTKEVRDCIQKDYGVTVDLTTVRNVRKNYPKTATPELSTNGHTRLVGPAPVITPREMLPSIFPDPVAGIRGLKEAIKHLGGKEGVREILNLLGD